MTNTPTNRLNLVFPSPVFVTRVSHADVLNIQLRQLIEEEWKTDRGITVSNQGGWHSKRTFLDGKHVAISHFKEEIRKAIKDLLFKLYGHMPSDGPADWDIQGWANINTHNTYNRSHDHNNLLTRLIQWSGIYYLDIGAHHKDDAISGVTVFEDRQITSGGFGTNRLPLPLDGETVSPREEIIQPESGKLVIFPGSLWHRVEKYSGSGKRITIAFNVIHQEYRLHVFPSKGGPFSSWLWRNFRGMMRLGEIIKHKLV